jgi:hypothetical protein
MDEARRRNSSVSIPSHTQRVPHVPQERSIQLYITDIPGVLNVAADRASTRTLGPGGTPADTPPGPIGTRQITATPPPSGRGRVHSQPILTTQLPTAMWELISDTVVISIVYYSTYNAHKQELRSACPSACIRITGAQARTPAVLRSNCVVHPFATAPSTEWVYDPFGPCGSFSALSACPSSRGGVDGMGTLST